MTGHVFLVRSKVSRSLLKALGELGQHNLSENDEHHQTEAGEKSGIGHVCQIGDGDHQDDWDDVQIAEAEDAFFEPRYVVGDQVEYLAISRACDEREIGPEKLFNSDPDLCTRKPIQEVSARELTLENMNPEQATLIWTPVRITK